ncbi:MAG TPA: hypothetical protein VGE67_06590 [Haloferula sp.]
MKLHGLLMLLGVSCSLAEGEKKYQIRKDVVIHESVVAGTEVKVVVSDRPFDPAKHRLSDKSNFGTKENPHWVPTVDLRPVVGNSVETEGRIPPAGSPQLSQITVHFGDVVVEVPQQLLSNVFFARLQPPGSFSLEYADSIVSVSSDAKCVLISLGVGEGGGQAEAFFAVGKDGQTSDQPPARNLPGR